MQINTQLAKSFNKAVTNADNFDADSNINWNFVDADVYMDMHPLNDDPVLSNKEHYAQFNYLADCYTDEKTVHQVRQDRLQFIPVTNPDLILDPSKPAYMVKTL